MFERRPYSGPWRRIGAEAWVQATPSEEAVLVDDVRVAAHARGVPATRSTVPTHLPAHRLELAERSSGVWWERATGLGPAVLGWADDQLEHHKVVLGPRRVQRHSRLPRVTGRPK
jgi:hypothetical protein